MELDPPSRGKLQSAPPEFLNYSRDPEEERERERQFLITAAAALEQESAITPSNETCGECSWQGSLRSEGASSSVQNSSDQCANARRGECKATDCSFAHGFSELRSTDSFYKTQLCLFWLSGRVGSSCRHAHGEEELVQRSHSRLSPFGDALDIGLISSISTAPEGAMTESDISRSHSRASRASVAASCDSQRADEHTTLITKPSQLSTHTSRKNEKGLLTVVPRVNISSPVGRPRRNRNVNALGWSRAEHQQSQEQQKQEAYQQRSPPNEVFGGPVSFHPEDAHRKDSFSRDTTQRHPASVSHGPLVSFLSFGGPLEGLMVLLDPLGASASPACFTPACNCLVTLPQAKSRPWHPTCMIKEQQWSRLQQGSTEPILQCPTVFRFPMYWPLAATALTDAGSSGADAFGSPCFSQVAVSGQWLPRPPYPPSSKPYGLAWNSQPSPACFIPLGSAAIQADAQGGFMRKGGQQQQTKVVVSEGPVVAVGIQQPQDQQKQSEEGEQHRLLMIEIHVWHFSMSRRNHYELLKCIGEGAYGRAYLATDTNGNTVVAKVIDVGRVPQKERMACIDEVKLLAALDHPFIVRYLDSYVEGQSLHIVMSFCDGGDLAGLLRAREDQNAPLPEKQIIRWLAQLLMAVKYTHQNKIIHRDIKSQNIFIEKNNRLRLADFGISKALESTQAQAKTFIGTPYYLSPELCKGSPYGPSSDVWAVGCVAFEMATFRTPFHQAKNLADLCYRICNAEIRFPSRVPPTFFGFVLPLCHVFLVLCYIWCPTARASAAKILEMPMMQGASQLKGLCFASGRTQQLMLGEEEPTKCYDFFSKLSSRHKNGQDY
ncbi:NEK kinase [Cyclospora cayetanensis]|uniref:non-specific serine/threonine protein kinase n=1 Tax=Cyclospora cayetanensis TaxID=88456 RepID=A0A1D3CSI3_9EIME|nr:NEK kinase [Cyclospora cayetanensis]